MNRNALLTQWFRFQVWQPAAWPARLCLVLTITLLAGALLFGSHLSIGAQPGANCSTSFLVDQTLSNGARWQFCWEHRTLDGIVLRDVYFTPPGGAGANGARRILTVGSIAQVHVPYDDNSARFHDITDDGFGGENLNDLTPAECPNGVLLKYGAKDALCQQIQPRGYSFKGLGLQEQGEQLSLFSVSASGEYNYIPVWRFLDDGTIELRMGAAGKLQRFTGDGRYGWPVRADGTLGTSHIHNYYWRLDFDLGESGENDLVEEFNYLPGADNATRHLAVTPLSNEAGRSLDRTGLRSWRIRDAAATNANGRAISYHLEPIDVAHRDVGPTFEPWTANTFYVTKYQACERYVSHNPQLEGCADNLAAFVNGESLAGADIVLWYGVTFHHIPRDEDEPNMHTHWSGFRLTPRDWLDANPAATITTCAVGDVTCDGQRDAADALFMLQHDVRLRTISDQLPLPEGTLYGYACDVSGEGACNSVDALLTLQCDVGLTNQVCPPAGGLHATRQPDSGQSPVVIVVGQGETHESGVRRIPIQIETTSEVGAVAAVLSYDSAWPGVVDCVADPASSFGLAACHVDPVAGVVRFSLISPPGASGNVTFGEVTFTSAEPDQPGGSFLALQSASVAAPDGARLPIRVRHVELFEQLYLPLVER